MPHNNPFFHGNPVPSDQLVGRNKELRDIAERIMTGQSTALTGSPRSGKTSILQYLKASEKQATLYDGKACQLIFSYMDAYTWGTQFNQAQFWESALKPIQERINADDTEPSLSEAYQICQQNEFGNYVLEKFIAYIKQANWQLVLMVDGFDILLHHPILNSVEFFGSLRALVSRSQGALVLIITGNTPLSQLGTEAQHFSRTTSPYFNFIEEIILGPLSDTEINQLLELGKEHFTENDIDFIKDIAGGHPYLLQVAASGLWKHKLYENKAYEKEPFKRQQQTQKFYFQVEDALDKMRQSWSASMQKAFTSVAFAQMKQLKGVFKRQGINVESISRLIPSLKRDLELLKLYGFVMEDESIAGGWRICSSIFLHFIILNFKQEYRDELPKEVWDNLFMPKFGDELKKMGFPFFKL
jgi:hypothetical protein